ncbi:MAG: ferrous iron transport protein B [Candidatus Aureabacteria bacterium]|nr:ferrous iron transport protein B [Candidatus Auribacterota bacterium]
MEYKIALAGNPNSGKTTLFNQLAGAREKIGNWPGTTVERKEGKIRSGNSDATVVDLPGIYSLSAYSLDERIARDFLVKETPSLVVAIIDASQLERNLYLVIQLLEMGLNIVLALNMMDIVEQRGMEIDVQELEEILHIPVIPTVASQGKGVDQLKKVIFSRLDAKPPTLHIDYGDIDDTLHALEAFLEKENISVSTNYKTLALKILENDPIVFEKLKTSPHLQKIKNVLTAAKNQLIEDPESYLLERRYAYIRGLVHECTTHHLTLEQRLTLSDKIDRVVTNTYLGIPIFLFFMFLLFTLVFKIGQPLVDLMDVFFSFLADASSHLSLQLGLPEWFASLVSDGIISGVGSVIVFLPYILLLFLGISCLEDSGYLARGAFIMDRLMHALGLHGKSFIPMLLGFGCTIPGIMAARTLDSEKDRIITILILPLMSCSARLPVYTLFAAALFPGYQGAVVFSLYLLGILLSILMAQLFKNILFKEESAPLVMELPPYRLPNGKNIITHMWIRALLFLKKAGTIIFAAVLLIWILASLPAGVEYASKESVIGKIGQIAAPAFKPAGFGDWKASVSLITGIIAKENVVGTLGTLYGVEEEGLIKVLRQHFTPLSAYAFLVMTLVYIPCVATIATIKNELNWKWAMLSVAYTLALGWILSVLFYQVGSLVL